MSKVVLLLLLLASLLLLVWTILVEIQLVTAGLCP